jgi:hypothetical protein
MGDAVRVSTVAIAQGNLTIRITETPQVSQPNAFAQGQTAVVPRTGRPPPRAAIVAQHSPTARPSHALGWKRLPMQIKLPTCHFKVT